jgi:hypothetical protein
MEKCNAQMRQESGGTPGICTSSRLTHRTNWVLVAVYWLEIEMRLELGPFKLNLRSSRLSFVTIGTVESISFTVSGI